MCNEDGMHYVRYIAKASNREFDLDTSYALRKKSVKWEVEFERRKKERENGK